MIELDKSTLRKLQLIELEMLIEVDRICRKCNIKYSIIAGTLLGAIRHCGFIPWDDDADVGMLREEYEKFRTACETELDTSKFYFQDHRNTYGYRWGYGKIRRKDTVFLREHQEHMPYEQGVFIDVFPLDGVPQNKVSFKIHNLKCYCFRRVLWSAVGRIHEKNIIYKRLYNILYMIPLDFIFAEYEKFVNKSNSKYKNKVRALTFPLPKYGMLAEKSWFINQNEYEFEKHKFYGVEEYDKYLIYKFGNYKILPPENERKTHPVSKIKLVD